jgi:hypothetical protein
MKPIFDTAAVLSAIAARSATPEKIDHGHIFRPLSAPAIYENRIDVTLKSTLSANRVFRYGRAGEKTN